MRISFSLILSISILLTFAACGRTMNGNIPPNEPSASSGMPKIETTHTAIPTPQPAPTMPVLGAEPVLTPTPAPVPEPSIIYINIEVGGSVFLARLHDNDTARTFIALLPLTLNMSELNGNEKYYYLPDKLPVDSQKVESINTGDLMLYGSECLVLFYESFTTSYSYTRIGYIEDVSGLAETLGSGSIVVTMYQK